MIMNTPSIFKCLCVYTVGVLFLIVAGFFLVVLPLQGRIQSENGEIQKFEVKVKNTDRKLDHLSEFESQFETASEGEHALHMLVPEQDVVYLIEKIEATAKDEGGVVVISQNNSATKTQQSTSKNGTAASIENSLPWKKALWLNVRFTGGYVDAVNFLHKVETLPYGLDVISVEIRPALPGSTPSRGSGDSIFMSAQTGSEPAPQEEAPSTPEVDASFTVAVYLEE